jgi:hypothetical protein
VKSAVDLMNLTVKILIAASVHSPLAMKAAQSIDFHAGFREAKP